MLPEMPGLEVLELLRQTGLETPIIIISAKGQDRDKVQGLELGADDYLTKPFGLSELLARIRAVLRRTKSGAKASARQQASVSGVMKFAGLTVDWRRFTVTVAGQSGEGAVTLRRFACPPGQRRESRGSCKTVNAEGLIGSRKAD